MKAIFALILFFTVHANALVIPAGGFDKSVLHCLFTGQFSINYYLNTGMVTYSDATTFTVTGDSGEEILTLNGTLKALNPSGLNKNYVLVDEKNTEILRLIFGNTTMNLVDNTFVSNYKTTYNSQQGDCFLLEDAPPINMEEILGRK